MAKTDKPFFHDDEWCKGCKRIAHFEDKSKGKGVCFGITTSEGRKMENIPVSDNLRFCIKHPYRPVKKEKWKGFFQKGDQYET